MKAAFVAVIGRPSAGKSTLLNTICGQKISIVAPSPQTTRNKVRGILNAEEGQLIFIDTPGYHVSERKFNIRMTELVASTLEETDLILYLIDSLRRPGEEESLLLEQIKRFPGKTVVALNKTDIDNNMADEISAFIKTVLPSAVILPVSALKKTGIEKLKSTLFSLAPEGEQMYPAEYYTDQPPEFRAAEIIREKAINRVKEELPHAIYVEIADIETNEEEQKLWIRAFLTVERETQKGILVGKGGAMIKAIRTEAQKELKHIFPYQVYLDLRVKVNPKWRKKDGLLKKLIR